MKTQMVRGDNCAWNENDASAFTDFILRESKYHGVIFMDTTCRITGWNRGAHFITGYTDKEAIGQSGAMLFTPEDRERKLQQHELNTAREVGVAEDERWHLRKDGSRFWSSGITLPLTAGGREVSGFVKIFRDATHLRARMKSLENTVRQLTTDQEQRNVFLGTLAHELRNPLSPLKMVLQLMQKKSDPGGHYEHSLEIMDRQLVFLERLVEDLVDLTRANTGKLSLAYQEVELQRLLTDSLEAHQVIANAKQITLHRVLPPVPILVEVDAERLNQVVVNLLNNAIKYTPEGGDVWLTASVDQTHSLIYVKDNGKGIGPELLPQIFDMFTQAEGADTHRGAGLGIGLALVKEIVALHQGTIEVRSEGDDKGSEFIVRLPLRKPHDSEREPNPDPRPH